MARQGAGSPPGAMRIIDGVIFRACRNRRHSSKNRILREDETRAYGAHHLAIGCLIFEGRAEFFLFAEIQDPRQDSAGKGHTAFARKARARSPAKRPVRAQQSRIVCASPPWGSARAFSISSI